MNPHTDPMILAARVRELEDLIRRLAWRILLAHEVIGRWADKDKPKNPAVA